MLNSPITYNVTQNVLDNDYCEFLIKYAQEHGNYAEGKIGGDKKQSNLTLDKDIRDTDLYFFSHQETYEKIMPYISSINNESGWNFDLQRIEPMQFSVYRTNGHYSWHIDTHPYPYSNEGPFFNMVRKISFTILLNSPLDYEGGEFEIEDKLPEVKERSHKVLDLEKGSMITFPSFIPHKVNPVISGTRYSLVGWVCGNPWR